MTEFTQFAWHNLWSAISFFQLLLVGNESILHRIIRLNALD